MSLQFLLTSNVLQPLRLTTAPDGWAGLRYLLARDERYHGVALSMSTDLTFWKQGAAYLRTLYEGGTDQRGVVLPAQGIEATAVLNAYEDDPNEFRTALVYRARVDFTQYRASDKGSIQVKLKELGLATNLLARSASAVDLLGGISLGGTPVGGFQPTTVLLHSQMLRLKYAASQTAYNELSPGSMFGDEGNLSHEQLLYFGFDTPADNDLGLEAVSGGFVAGDASKVVPIYTAKESGLFTIELSLDAFVSATNNGDGPEFETVEGDCYLRIVRQGQRTDYRLIDDFKSENLGGDFTNDIQTGARTFTADLVPGDSIYLYARYFVHDIGGLGTSIRYRSVITAAMRPGSYLRITAESTTAPTACRGLLVYEALARLTAAMGDQAGGFYSEYYGRTDCTPAYPVDGPGALRLLTNGFGLRGFPLPTDAGFSAGETDPRKPLTADFDTLYNGLDAQDCLGAGFEQRGGQPTLRIEHRAYFFQPTETLRLGAVQQLVKQPYSPLFFNQVQVGYQHWQSGAAVGLDEFNGQRTYATPLASVKATYSLLSPVNAGGYLIEQARRQPFAMGTNAEGQADQELFSIRLRRSAGGQLATEKAEAFTRVAGILDADTAYNLRDSPGRMLRRHGAWLRAGLVPQTAATKRLALGVVAGNDKLVSQLATETQPVDEHADVMLAELPAPYLQAETYEFTARLRRHELKALVAKPYGLISFLDQGGHRKRGYLLKVECAPASRQATFTLLRAA